jgi:hypothetical protein
MTSVAHPLPTSPKKLSMSERWNQESFQLVPPTDDPLNDLEDITDSILMDLFDHEKDMEVYFSSCPLPIQFLTPNDDTENPSSIASLSDSDSTFFSDQATRQQGQPIVVQNILSSTSNQKNCLVFSGVMNPITGDVYKPDMNPITGDVNKPDEPESGLSPTLLCKRPLLHIAPKHSIGRVEASPPCVPLNHKKIKLETYVHALSSSVSEGDDANQIATSDDNSIAESFNTAEDQIKKERNRVHAQQSRVRRKCLTNDLHSIMQHLREDNQRLRVLIANRFGSNDLAQQLIDQQRSAHTQRFIDQLRQRKNHVVHAKTKRFLRGLQKNLQASRSYKAKQDQHEQNKTTSEETLDSPILSMA